MEHYGQIHKFIHPINLQQIVSQINGQYFVSFFSFFFCSLAVTSTGSGAFIVLWFHLLGKG